MSCVICFSNDENTQKICFLCKAEAHDDCLKRWTTPTPGAIISKNNMNCPVCFHSLDMQIIEFDPKYIYIVCGICKKIKIFCEKLCRNSIDQTISLICSDCEIKKIKQCPECCMNIEKQGGCNHIHCRCGSHWCWICGAIKDEKNIYKHIADTHMHHLDAEVEYQEYFYRIVDNTIRLNEVPREFWTEELLLEALANDIMNMVHIKNPSQDFCKRAITRNYRLIALIPEIYITEELCKQVLEINSNAILYIRPEYLPEEKYIQICEKIVRDSPNMIRSMKIQTYKMCLWAIKSNGARLEYIKNEFLTNDEYMQLCFIAVQDCGTNLHYCNIRTYELCYAAVNNCGYAMEYIYEGHFTKEQYYNLAMIALNRHVHSINLIKNPTFDMYKKAIESDPSVFRYINPKNLSDKEYQDLCRIVLKIDGLYLCNINTDKIGCNEKEFYHIAVMNNALCVLIVPWKYRLVCMMMILTKLIGKIMKYFLRKIDM